MRVTGIRTGASVFIKIHVLSLRKNFHQSIALHWNYYYFKLELSLNLNQNFVTLRQFRYHLISARLQIDIKLRLTVGYGQNTLEFFFYNPKYRQNKVIVRAPR